VNLVVVFLGKRGAGARFVEIFRNYGDEFLPGQMEFLISSRCAREFPEIASRSHVIKTFEDWRYLAFFPWIFTNQVKVLFNICKKQKKKFLFVLPSPSDLLIIKILKFLKIELYFMIHDLQSHLGENWPTKNSIRLRLTVATRIFTLSQFVYNKLDSAAKEKSFVISHPIFPINFAESSSNQPSIPGEYLLCIGRIREYKGIDDLIKAYSLVKDAPTLVIAGEGHIELLETSKIFLINRWLKDEEIEILIASASLVILPYREATQSGIIPICRLFEKPLIVSDSGALVEQAIGSKRLWVFQPGDIMTLNDHIRAFLNSRNDPPLPNISPVTEEISRKSINSSRFFVKQVIERIFVST